MRGNNAMFYVLYNCKQSIALIAVTNPFYSQISKQNLYSYFPRRVHGSFYDGSRAQRSCSLRTWKQQMAFTPRMGRARPHGRWAASRPVYGQFTANAPSAQRAPTRSPRLDLRGL